MLCSQPSSMGKDCWVLQSGYIDTQHIGRVHMFGLIETRGEVCLCSSPVYILFCLCVKIKKFSGKFTLLNGYLVTFYTCKNDEIQYVVYLYIRIDPDCIGVFYMKQNQGFRKFTI